MRYKKIFVPLFIIIITISAFVSLYAFGNQQDRPKSVGGVLNLSDWDFSKGRPSLTGEWEFYWNRLLTFEDFSKENHSERELVYVPKTWDTYETAGKKLPGFGYATYRLKVITKDPQVPLSLRLDTMSTAYRLFINDKEIAANGTVGIDKNTSIPWYQPLVVEFTPLAEEFNIIVQVSNFTYARGGIWYEMNLGTHEQIAALNSLIIYKDAVLIGSLLIMVLYYASFYFVLKSDKSSKYFMWLCIIFIVRTSLYGDILINRLFPNIPFRLVILLTYATLYWIPVVIYLMIDSIFESYSKFNFKRLFLIYAVAATALTAVLPIYVYTQFITPIEIIILLMGVIVVHIVLKAYFSCKKWAGLMLFAVFFILVTGVHDMLYQANIIYNSFGELASIGIFIFMFTFSFILAGYFSDSFDRARKLAVQLSDSLEKEKAMTQKLYEYDKYKDEFLANTSHELKTPLHGIMNITQHVMDNLNEKLSGKHREDLGYVITTAKRLASLINDIIDFQSIKANSLHLDMKTMDVNGSVQVVLEVMDKLFASKKITVKNHIPYNQYFVLADEGRIRQIMYNLVGNALKHTENGCVEISAGISEEKLVISVKDTGAGIEKNRQELIFNYFEYSNRKPDENYTSTGLGLPIARQLAERMGGSLWLKWSEPGIGSEFAFSLPMAEKPDEAKEIQTAVVEAAAATEIKQPDQNGGERQMSKTSVSFDYAILIVDDEVTNVKIVADIFAGERCDIFTAFNGQQALKLIRENRSIGLVLLDVMMPGMSGFEVCRRIREEYTLFDLPVLLLTVKNTPEDIAAGLDSGANDFLPKPFDARELKARVRTLLELKQSVRNSIHAETAFLQSQIKPHFIFNALSVITSLCYVDGAQAGRFLEEFSHYLRCSFDFDPYSSFVSLEKELSMVRSYVEIEKVRFGERLRVNYDIDEHLNMSSIPALILQPLVENAIRHGLMKRMNGGTVEIKAWKEAASIQITVKDDGVGISVEKLLNLLDINKTVTGVGIRNIHQRLLNLYGQGLKIESREGEGTLVRLSLPCNKSATVADL